MRRQQFADGGPVPGVSSLDEAPLALELLVAVGRPRHAAQHSR